MLHSVIKQEELFLSFKDSFRWYRLKLSIQRCLVIANNEIVAKQNKFIGLLNNFSVK